jgi:hypothetical protein
LGRFVSFAPISLHILNQPQPLLAGLGLVFPQFQSLLDSRQVASAHQITEPAAGTSHEPWGYSCTSCSENENHHHVQYLIPLPSGLGTLGVHESWKRAKDPRSTRHVFVGNASWDLSRPARSHCLSQNPNHP